MKEKLFNLTEKAMSLCIIASIIVFFARIPRIIESLYEIMDKIFIKYFGKIYNILNIILCVLTMLDKSKKRQKMLKNCSNNAVEYKL